MIVFGRGLKDKKIIFAISLTVTFIIAVLFFVYSIFLETDSDKLVCYIMIGFFLLSFVIFLVIFIFQSIKKNEVILFDLEKKNLIINCYKKTFEIIIYDIKFIKVKNKGLGTIGPLVFPTTYKYGRLKFYLKNGNKITTPVIYDVESVKVRITEEINSF